MTDEAKKEQEPVKTEQAVETKSSTPESVEQKVAAKIEELKGSGSLEPEKKETLPEKKELPPEKKEVEPEKKEVAEKTSTLPAGYRRAALARGWTNEEIDHYVETKPDEAMNQFQGIFSSWQEDNAKWSERGRQLVAATKEETKTETEKPPQKTEELKPLDEKALIEQYGNEELIKPLVSRVNSALEENRLLKERLDKVEGNIGQSQEAMKSAQEEATFTATQNFLLSDGMKQFQTIYGTEIKTLTKEQVDNRMKLFEEADVIICGALDHGQELTVEEALDRAHAHISRGQTEETIRAQIRESLQKRTKTLSNSTNAASLRTTQSNEDVSDAELEQRTEQRLAALRNRS